VSSAVSDFSDLSARDRGNAVVMLYIQIKADCDPKALAELIASQESTAPVDPKLEIEATMLREHQEQVERDRPTCHELETVNYQKLDDDNDWTDL
jgi:hypothetical protein